MGIVVVTGAGGFVGSAVVRRLVEQAAAGRARFADGSAVEHVVAVLRPGGSRYRLEGLAPSASWSTADVDLEEPAQVAGLMSLCRPRAVVHVALDRTAYSEVADVDVGERIHQHPVVALAAGLSGVRGGRFIHTGSAWVLAPGGRLAESAPARPLSPYARVKWRTDVLLPGLCQGHGVEWVNLRLFNTYGRYEDESRLLPYLVERLANGRCAELSAGNQVRDFNDVDDMAEAYLLALRAPAAAANRLYHVGSGVGMTVRDFARTVADVTGGGDLIRFGTSRRQDLDLQELVADPGQAVRHLGWQPPQQIAERIRRAANWWCERLRAP